MKADIDIALVMVDYLICEIKEERMYNVSYEREKLNAKKKAKSSGEYWGKYMDRSIFNHEPRKSIIKDNSKMIRRLMLKIRGE